jgi:hypothetical protein
MRAEIAAANEYSFQAALWNAVAHLRASSS